MKNRNICCLSALLWLFFTPLSIGQNNQDSLRIIELNNPSLEMFSGVGDSLMGRLRPRVQTGENLEALVNRAAQRMGTMRVGTLPQGWETCNFKGETIPNLLSFGSENELKPMNGNFYVGMVGRDNGTFESITQTLPAPLRVGVCYKLSVHLAKSPTYKSVSRITGKPENFNRPLKLVILGVGGDSCKFLEQNVIAVSPPIPNNNWRKFTFIIRPTTHDITRLIFAAQFVIDKPYNGNILIDNFSQIVPVNCDDMSVSPLLGAGVARNATVAMNQTLGRNAPQLKFVRKQPQLVGEVENTEGGTTIRNRAYDAILAELALFPQYKLLIRVKKGKRLSKKRMAFLYSYIFRNTSLPARRVEIKRYKSEDEFNFWSFENDDFAIGYGLME
jgi:hypothetical protein